MTFEESKTCFKLFANCIIVDGICSSLIYDLGRNESYEIDYEISNFLKKIQSVSLNEFIESSGYPANEVYHFIEKFINQELGFFTNDPKSHIDIDFNWESPYIITNAIIEFNSNSIFDVNYIIEQLNYLGCPALELRFNFQKNLIKIAEILKAISDTRIKSIDLIIPYDFKTTETAYSNFINEFPKIRVVKIYGAGFSKVVNSEDILVKNRIIYSKNNNDQNEILTNDRFIYNLETFIEAKQFNTGLNRKVTITGEGNIKNFLNHKKTFGKISRDKIVDIVLSDDFQSSWHISNDNIEKCRDCQYRYACVSNSEIIIENRKYHKKNTCSYNPYINKWN